MDVLVGYLTITQTFRRCPLVLTYVSYKATSIICVNMDIEPLLVKTASTRQPCKHITCIIHHVSPCRGCTPSNNFQLRDMQLGGTAREGAETEPESTAPVWVGMHFLLQLIAEQAKKEILGHVLAANQGYFCLCFFSAGG
jgi:hypothetical protein